MKSLYIGLFIVLFISVSINAQNKVVGYIPARSVSAMTTENFSRITQAIYFGLDVNDEGVLSVDDSKNDLNYLDSLRSLEPVELSVCFGGWGRSDFFAPVTASEDKRALFCSNVLQLCKDYNLASIDLDWEFPKNKKELSDYVILVKDLHRLLDPEGIEITIAVGFWDKQARLVAEMEPYLAGVNLMTYDNVSPSKGHASYDLVKRSVKRFIKHGIPPEKLLVGVPFYGRHRLSRQKTMAYHQVPGLWESISDKGEYEGYYFSSPANLKRKMDLINKKKLGGIMIWELGHDVESSDPFSLLNYINSYIK
ncbi:glycosyl hydrolase family 18 protein [Carboxylicivirga sp. RSCT41]|uniref:glycosyl hydrolase family 18 protein n=1 Tax=Carboxylicivirga agarovorans TaxID=3417570 RepID=UPI003D354641